MSRSRNCSPTDVMAKTEIIVLSNSLQRYVLRVDIKYALPCQRTCVIDVELNENYFARSKWGVYTSRLSKIDGVNGQKKKALSNDV
jgi:hypothetical protein